MKKIFALLIIILVIAVALATTTAAAQTVEQLKLEVAALRDHNERLIKALEYKTAKADEHQVVAMSITANAEQQYEVIEEAQDYLWMAESALEELERIVKGRASQSEMRIIIRDIREVIREAKRLLDEAISLKSVNDQVSLDKRLHYNDNRMHSRGVESVLC